jgi:hypothetical protein
MASLKTDSPVAGFQATDNQIALEIPAVLVGMRTSPLLRVLNRQRNSRNKHPISSSNHL